jgi:hypothetical protein
MNIAGTLTGLAIFLTLAVADRTVLPDRSVADALLRYLTVAAAMVTFDLAFSLTLRTRNSFDVIHIDAFHGDLHHP